MKKIIICLMILTSSSAMAGWGKLVRTGMLAGAGIYAANKISDGMKSSNTPQAAPMSQDEADCRRMVSPQMKRHAYCCANIANPNDKCSEALDKIYGGTNESTDLTY